MKRRTLLLSILIFAMMAAANLIPPLLRTPRTSTTLSSQPDVMLKPEPTSLSSSAGGTISLLAVTRTENDFGLQAQPVDPTTLTALRGYAPINFGSDYTYAASPDHQTLAVITWPSSSNIRGVLHLIDLETWTDTLADLQIDDDVSELTFSPDGKMLYWTIPTEHYPSGSYQLLRYDLAQRELSVITQFPPSFTPWAQRLISGQVAIFGVPIDSNYITEAVPELFLVDPVESRITADLKLGGVLAGQYREQATNETSPATEGDWQYVMYNPGLAWDMERGLLYIARASDDRVTKVDLAKGAIITQANVRPQPSLMEWISESLAPTAEAKGGVQTQKRTLLSPDGKWLYVFSQKTEWGELGPTSLRVITTADLREISRLDGLLTDFALTPDGNSLLIAKAEIVSPYGFDMPVNRDIYVLDAKTLRERAHLQLDQLDQRGFEGFALDGQSVYLKGASARWVEGSGWRDWQTHWQLLDLNSYRLRSSGKPEGSFATLLHIGP